VVKRPVRSSVCSSCSATSSRARIFMPVSSLCRISPLGGLLGQLLAGDRPGLVPGSQSDFPLCIHRA
jgi:hypothetical protein